MHSIVQRSSRVSAGLGGHRGWSLGTRSHASFRALLWRHEKGHVCYTERQEGHADRQVGRGRGDLLLRRRLGKPALNGEEHSCPADQPRCPVSKPSRFTGHAEVATDLLRVKICTVNVSSVPREEDLGGSRNLRRPWAMCWPWCFGHLVIPCPSLAACKARLQGDTRCVSHSRRIGHGRRDLLRSSRRMSLCWPRLAVSADGAADGEERREECFEWYTDPGGRGCLDSAVV